MIGLGRMISSRSFIPCFITQARNYNMNCVNIFMVFGDWSIQWIINELLCGSAAGATTQKPIPEPQSPK